MATLLKAEISKKSPWYIPKERYYELLHFCRQYTEWQERLKDINGLVRTKIADDPCIAISYKDWGDPVCEAVEKREKYIRKTNMVLSALRAITDDEVVQASLLDTIVKEKTYDQIVSHDGPLPVCRNKYYELYRKFFFTLDQIRG